MYAKQKAKELVNYFDELLEVSTVSFVSPLPNELATKVVKEILNNSVLNYSGSDFSDNEILSDTEYWNEVLIEIDKL